MNSHKSQSSHELDAELVSGLGGWLIPLIALVCLFPLFHSAALFHILFTPEELPKWDIFLRGENHPLQPWSLAWCLESFVHFTGLLLAAYNLALIFAKRKIFVTWCLVYLLTIPLARIFGNAAYSLLGENEAEPIIKIFWSMLAHLISIGYLLNAKRVKNTFIN